MPLWIFAAIPAVAMQHGALVDNNDRVEIVVGVNQEPASSDALALGCALAATLNADLVVANIYPKAWDFVGPAHVDAEWQKFLVDQGNETLAWAREELDDREGVTYVLHPNRSSGVGLTEVAQERGSQMIVIGSSPGGSKGRIAGGCTRDQLFHGSPVPVGIAPQGYARWAPPAIKRAVVAYQPNGQSDHCLDVTIRSLKLNGMDPVTQMLLFTIVQRVTRIYGSRLGRHAEDQVLTSLREQSQESLDTALERVGGDLGDQAIAGNVPTEILEGDDVIKALGRYDWDDADLMVTGSTGTGPIRRVFLGDMTFKLIRGSTIPVVVIPRGAVIGSA